MIEHTDAREVSRSKVRLRVEFEVDEAEPVSGHTRDISMPFAWSPQAPRIPEEEWTRRPLGELALKYDTVETHGWYSNLDPVLDRLVGLLSPGDLVVDYSGGTGILVDRLLKRVGELRFACAIVDASPKFLRLAADKLGDDERVRVIAASLDIRVDKAPLVRRQEPVAHHPLGVAVITAHDLEAVDLFVRLDLPVELDTSVHRVCVERLHENWKRAVGARTNVFDALYDDIVNEHPGWRADGDVRTHVPFELHVRAAQTRKLQVNGAEIRGHVGRPARQVLQPLGRVC